MAEIDLDTYVRGEIEVTYLRSNGLNFPQADTLNSAVDIKDFVNYFEIHNSFDLAFRVGILSLFDSHSFREKIGFVGNDIITINYTTRELASNTSTSERKQATFRIINIEEIAPQTSDPAQGLGKRRTINLTLAEFPLYDYYVLNQIYRTYEWDSGTSESNPQGTMSISGIINDLLSEEVSPFLLSGWGYDLDIERTSDIADPSKLWNFYVPRWSLLKTVNYLKKFANTLIGNYPYYVFCSRDVADRKIITFKSIYSIINDKFASILPLEYVPRFSIQTLIKNGRAANPNWLANAIISFKYEFYNGIDASFGGLGGKTYISHDYFDGIKGEAYSFDQYKIDYKNGLDSYFIYKNSFGTQWDNVYYNSLQNRNKDMMVNSFAKKAMNSVRCVATCHMNPFRYIGQHAKLSINSVDTVNGGNVDSIHNGNWLTWGITDYYNSKDQTIMSEVEFVKDSMSINFMAAFGLETAGG